MGNPPRTRLGSGQRSKKSEMDDAFCTHGRFEGASAVCRPVLKTAICTETHACIFVIGLLTGCLPRSAIHLPVLQNALNGTDFQRLVTHVL